MQLITPDDVTLSFSGKTIGGHFEPYCGLIREQSVEITIYRELAESVTGVAIQDDRDEITVGHMTLGVLDLGAVLNERESLFEVCDSLSQTYHVLERTLFANNGEFKDSVFKALGVDAPCHSGLMYVKSLVVDPLYRGRNIGLAALHTLMRFGCMGCGTIFLQAHPIVKKEDPEDYDYAKERKALRAYYSKLGFERIGRTDYMGFNLEYVLPGWPKQ